ncbi:hypothetical protein BVX94_01660 [bacterium B17]|nr:hypothetical protein BVX94_01660 [bacterium B17]
MRVRDIPERMRPREELDRLGVGNVSDDLLLAIILRSGVPGMNVVEISRALMTHYGSFTAMSRASIEELSGIIRGMGPVKAQVLASALEIARRLGEERVPASPSVRTPLDVQRIMMGRIRPLEKEIFWTLRLDARNRMKGEPVEVTKGLLDASLVHPREVFREAIRSAAAAVVLVHNHPSGDPSPSAEDIRITKQMVEAGRIVDIKVLDHVIVGADNGSGNSPFVSLREEGVVKF